YARLQAQCDQLRGARRTNRIERVRVGRAQPTEAWQESGQDWVTVYFAVSLVDYTVDDTTGAVVEGTTTPVDIEEYWTFTRPVGSISSSVRCSAAGWSSATSRSNGPASRSSRAPTAA